LAVVLRLSNFVLPNVGYVVQTTLFAIEWRKKKK